MIVIVVAIECDWQRSGGRQSCAITLVKQPEPVRIHMPAHLQEAQNLLRMSQEHRADGAIGHHHCPVVCQQIRQEPRHLPPYSVSNVRTIARLSRWAVAYHVVSHAQTEENTGILVARGIADPVIALASYLTLINAQVRFL